MLRRNNIREFMLNELTNPVIFFERVKMFGHVKDNRMNTIK